MTGANAMRVDRTGENFPGVKQQREASAKAESSTILKEDREMLKAARQEEDANKRALLEREKENYTRIYALKCYNGWLKIYDNSAMILSRRLDGKLGRTYEAAADRGYGTAARYGVVSIPPTGVGDLIERLAKVGVALRRDDAWTLEFELGERVPQGEMVRMLHEDELLIEKTNSLTMPRAMFPNLRADVKLLLEFVFTHIHNQKNTMKEVFLNDVEREVVRANKMLIAAARGRIRAEECLGEMTEFVEEMYENATTMSDMKLITAKQYKDFVGLIRRVEMERAREVKRMAVAKTEKEIKKVARAVRGAKK